jgi:hypothetical protein
VKLVLDAYISGQARLAAVIEGFLLVCLEHGHGSTENRNILEFDLLFAEVSDLRLEPCQDWTEVSDKLKTAVQQDDALALLLILLDEGADYEARQGTVPLIEEALAHSEVRNFLQKRFSGSPLPGNANLEQSLAWAISAGTSRLVNLLRWVGSLQIAIQHVCAAWETLPDEFFLRLPEKSALRLSLRDAGVHYHLATGNIDAALAPVPKAETTS